MTQMVKRLFCAVLLAVVGLPVSAAVQQQAPVPLNPQLAPRDYLVGPEDVLNIRFTGIDPGDLDMNTLYPVQADGKIQVKYIHAVDVQGKSAIWVADRIKELLVPDYFPATITVTVTVQEFRSQAVFINGAVLSPGIQQLRGSEMKLSRAIAAAGQFSQTAGDEIEIRRKGPDGKEVVISITKSQLEQGEDPDLVAGDSVFVKQGQVYFINGEVNSPGQKVWQPGMTLARALAVAGLKTTASIGRSYIKRPIKGANGKVDYKQVKNLKDNTPIEPDDEIVIRKKWLG